MADLTVAGAGMAGLVAAAEARSRGASVRLLEKAGHAGGSMLLSSGVIWRHKEFARFRSECPEGDASLQRALFERLDGDLLWLESLGARVLERETSNPLTTGARFDTAGLTAALFEAAGGVSLRESLSALPDGAPLILATGGFQANRELVRRYITSEASSLVLRAAPGSAGDGMRIGLEAGGSASAGLEQFYGRNMPAPPAQVNEGTFVELAQLYARYATVTNSIGERYRAATWSEIDVVQWTARQPGARAWYTVAPEALDERVGKRTVGQMVGAARAAGAPVTEASGGEVTVEVIAGITTTLGGLRIDDRAQVAPGLFACGADAGGIATGGYASGLAAALVFGRIAAASALAELG